MWGELTIYPADSFVVQTDQTVVVEFPKPLPAAGLITLAFYVDGRNVQLGSNVPVARLGPCTVKANFPSKFANLLALCASEGGSYAL